MNKYFENFRCFKANSTIRKYSNCNEKLEIPHYTSSQSFSALIMKSIYYRQSLAEILRFDHFEQVYTKLPRDPLETLADTAATDSACRSGHVTTTSVQSTASYTVAKWLRFNYCPEILRPYSPKAVPKI